MHEATHCCIVLHCVVLYFVILYCVLLHCIVLYCIVLYCNLLYGIALCCIKLPEEESSDLAALRPWI